MMGMTRPTVLLSILVMSMPACAHRLSVFAYAEGSNIVGEAYFAGGAKAAGIDVSVLDSAGGLVQKATTGPQGAFTITPPSRTDYRVVAQTGDGHRAEWTVHAAEFTEELPRSDAQQARTSSETPLASPSTMEQTDRGEMIAAIETAVARQVGPLRAELQAYRDAARLSDIVGGIGFIFGLAGLAMWWRCRKLPTGR